MTREKFRALRVLVLLLFAFILIVTVVPFTREIILSIANGNIDGVSAVDFRHYLRSFESVSFQDFSGVKLFNPAIPLSGLIGLLILGFYFSRISALELPIILLSGIRELINTDKRKVKFGRLYDSINKHSVPFVEVHIYDSNNKLVQATNSDENGCIYADLEEGEEYYIIANKLFFHFPSEIVKGEYDGPTSNLLHASNFKYKKDKLYQIPIDDLSYKGFGNIVLSFADVFATILLTVAILTVSISYLEIWYEFIFLEISIAAIPIALQSVIMAVVAVIALSDIKLNGRIIAEYSPVSGVEVSLKDMASGNVVDRRFTDRKGKYIFQIPKGKFKVFVSDKRYEMTDRREYFTVENKSDEIMYFTKDIRVRENGSSSSLL